MTPPTDATATGLKEAIAPNHRLVPQAWIDRAMAIETAARTLMSHSSDAIQRANDGSKRLYAANIEMIERGIDEVIEAVNLPEPVFAGSAISSEALSAMREAYEASTALARNAEVEVTRLRALLPSASVGEREALEDIARSRFGLQGIQEDFGSDTNAYNYQAMKYWMRLAMQHQNTARAALATPTNATDAGRVAAVATSVDDELTRAFIDGWNATIEHDDFDMALHFWMLSSVTHVGSATSPTSPSRTEGSSACPICGDGKPHHHTKAVADAYYSKGSRNGG